MDCDFANFSKLKILKISTLFLYFRHSDKREFLCNECGKTFKRKDKLQEHTKRIHSQERKARNLAAAQAAQQAQQAPAAAPAPEALGAPLVINEEASGSNIDKFVPRVSFQNWNC